MNHLKKFDIEYMRQLASEVLGMTLHPEKYTIATKNGDIQFLGYNMNGYRIIKDDLELLRGILYAEHKVKSVEDSLSRLIAYYMLGGACSEIFCLIFRAFIEEFGIDMFTFNPDNK